MKGNTTSWVVTGLGATVAAIGSKFMKGRLGAGITGFGLAHLLLGTMDMFRPTVNNK